MDGLGNFLVLVFAGSALGGVARYVVSEWVTQRLGNKFPAGTMLVNVTGCLLIGVVWTFPWGDLAGLSVAGVRAFLVFGFLGGYTTVSTYALNSLMLFRKGETRHAAVNLFGTFFLCSGAILAGVALGSWFEVMAR